MSDSKRQTKGPWLHRFAITMFGVVLAVLIYWLLGFVVDDIGSFPGPQFSTLEKKYLDQTLVEKQKDLEKRIADVKRKIDELQRKRALLGDTTSSLQKTLDQLLELQRLSLQKGVKLPETEQKAFTESLSLFLSNQKRYQGINEDIAELMEEDSSLTVEKTRIEELLETQRAPAREEYRALVRKHKHKVAFFQLLVLIPLLAAGAFLFVRRRSSIYFPLFLAFGAAILLKVGVVIHQHFPSRAFKYVLILFSLGVVIRLLIYFIRSIAFPKRRWLLKQYREAYEKFLCPICEYPIRRGPMKYLYWNRRSIGKLSVPQMSKADESSYACPVCSTRLFEECPSCHSMRHSLLPFCEYCGAEKGKDNAENAEDEH